MQLKETEDSEYDESINSARRRPCVIESNTQNVPIDHHEISIC